MALAAMFLDKLLRLVRILFFRREVGDHDIGTLHCEQDGDSTANARVTTSDECFLGLEFAGCFVGLISAIFFGNLGAGWLNG